MKRLTSEIIETLKDVSEKETKIRTGMVIPSYETRSYEELEKWYRACAEKLFEYENLEENGMFPCKEKFYNELLDYRKAEKILVEDDKNRNVWYISNGEIYEMQGNTVLLLIKRGIHKFYDTYQEAKKALNGNK